MRKTAVTMDGRRQGMGPAFQLDRGKEVKFSRLRAYSVLIKQDSDKFINTEDDRKAEEP